MDFLKRSISTRKTCGFTLIETVVALGVFAFSVSVLLGFFVRSHSLLRESEERLKVARMLPSVNSTLSELGWNRAKHHGNSGIVEFTEGGPFYLVADLNASRILLQESSDGIAPADQYYLLRVDRYEEEGLVYGVDTHGVLVLKVQVEWPYRVPASSRAGYLEIRSEDRSRFEFVSTVRP